MTINLHFQAAETGTIWAIEELADIFSNHVYLQESCKQLYSAILLRIFVQCFHNAFM